MSQECRTFVNNDKICCRSASQEFPKRVPDPRKYRQDPLQENIPRMSQECRTHVNSDKTIRSAPAEHPKNVPRVPGLRKSRQDLLHERIPEMSQDRRTHINSNKICSRRACQECPKSAGSMSIATRSAPRSGKLRCFVNWQALEVGSTGTGSTLHGP